jgi:hypothetical protein
MNTGLIATALIIACLAAVLPSATNTRILAAQITLVQSNQPRNQGQNQQGLSPEKKSTLSRYGPEDVFPGANEREARPARSNRAMRRSRTAASVKQSTGPEQAATSIATPSPAVAALSGISNGIPSPTADAMLTTRPTQQPLPPQQPSSARPSEWTVPILSLLALVVSAALIFVLIKLGEKIREGSS